jgi:hypothetical protein
MRREALFNLLTKKEKRITILHYRLQALEMAVEETCFNLAKQRDYTS